MVLRSKGLPSFSGVHTLPLTLSAPGGDLKFQGLACSLDREVIKKAIKHLGRDLDHKRMVALG